MSGRVGSGALISGAVGAATAAAEAEGFALGAGSSVRGADGGEGAGSSAWAMRAEAKTSEAHASAVARSGDDQPILERTSASLYWQ